MSCPGPAPSRSTASPSCTSATATGTRSTPCTTRRSRAGASCSRACRRTGGWSRSSSSRAIRSSWPDSSTPSCGRGRRARTRCSASSWVPRSRSPRRGPSGRSRCPARLHLLGGGAMGGVERSETRYARSGDLSIAYQVVGEGPFDLVYVPGWVSNIDLMWDEPGYAAFLERLASFSRLIIFDKRGTGLSDPVPLDQLPTLEQRMDDVRAVMDAAESERAALLGHSEGGNMCVLFSATYPERTTALVLVGCYAKRIRSDDYPWAPAADDREREIEETEARWGSLDLFRLLAPSKSGDEVFERWVGRYFRQSASPKAAAALLRMNTQIDVREVLPAIRVPTVLI